MILGNVDWIGWDRIRGWVVDNQDQRRPLDVEILVDGRIVATVRAELPPPEPGGPVRRGGRKLFTVGLPHRDATTPYVMEARVVGEETLLSPGPVRVLPPGVQTADKAIATPRRPGRKHVVIHVGPPKTGTKYLQTLLTRMAPVLHDAGIFYPTEGTPNQQVVVHHQLCQGLDDPPSALARLLRSIASTHHQCVVLSSESFVWQSERALANLRDAFDDADFEIIYYARRWSDAIPSRWKEQVTNGRIATFHEYLADQFIGIASLPAVNHGFALRKFGNVFGSHAISIVSYNGLLDQGVNTGEHFFRRILGWRDVLPVPLDRIHESVSMVEAEWMRVTNTMHHYGRGPYAALRHLAETDDLKFVMNAMQRHVLHVEIDDNHDCFRSIQDDVLRHFGGSILGGTLFEPRRTQLDVISQAYLVEPGILTRLGQLSDRVGEFVAARQALLERRAARLKDIDSKAKPRSA